MYNPMHPSPVPQFEKQDFVVDMLNRLLAMNLNAINGYQVAMDDIETLRLRTIFHEFFDTHHVIATKLTNLVIENGGEPVKTGTVAGAAHRGWMNVKAAITDSELAVLKAVHFGERELVKTYDNILDDTDFDELLRTKIVNQRKSIESMMKRIEELKGEYR